MGMHGFSRTIIRGIFICTAIALWAQDPAPKAAQPSNVRQLGQLQPHHRVEYEIAGGNIDDFTIDVQTGHFMHAVADQQGVDVVLSILDPAGSVLITADSPNGTTGPEPASIIAPLTGTYRLQISALDKSAPPGKYSLEITEVRASRKQDERELSAERNLFEAVRLVGRKNGSENKIVELLQSAVQDWHALGNRYEENLNRQALCAAYSGSGNQKEALICFEQTLTSLEMDGDRAGQERMLGVFAVAQYDSGKKAGGIRITSEEVSARPGIRE